MQGLLTIAALAWLIALSVCDVRTHRLPNLLTVPGAVAVIGVAAAAGCGQRALAGALALALAYLVVHLVAPGGLGAGDVKLAIGLGALTGAFGAAAWTSAALGAPLLTAAWALARRRALMPHGPAMCASSGSAVALCWWF